MIRLAMTPAPARPDKLRNVRRVMLKHMSFTLLLLLIPFLFADSQALP